MQQMLNIKNKGNGKKTQEVRTKEEEKEKFLG